jgi:hypothetical protein
MSKKLIAVASAAALALTGLVGIAPAMASAPTFTIAGGTGSEAGTAGAPRLANVPSLNKIETGTSNSAVSLEVGSLAIGDVVSITSTGSVKFVFTQVTAASANFNAANLGIQSYSTTKTNTDAITVYAYNTSTTAGTIAATVTRTGLTASQTFHIKGVAGLAYNIAAVAGVPATLSNTATSVVSFTVSDVFGNVIEDRDAVSTDAVRTNMGLITWDATAKVYKSTMTSPSTGAFIASIDLASADRSILGLPDSKQELVATVNVAGASTQVASLTAQVAALTAQLAASRPIATSVTKKKYNTLARKWNAAFPSQKVALKK